MTTQDKLIKAKLNLLELGAYLGNVSEACRTQGYSRDTFYRLKKRYEASFHRKQLDEFYRVAFRRKIYRRSKNCRRISTCGSTSAITVDSTRASVAKGKHRMIR